MTPSPRIIALAEAVADGQLPDWDQAESSATDDHERVAIARLRALAAVGEMFTAVTYSTLTRQKDAAREVLPPGTIWGSLRILAHAGQGRFGHVYRAWDAALEREVALKLLFETRPDDGPDSGVVHEGRLMARVRHPNVATIHGAQRINGLTGLWMEFIEGRTLADELAERGPLAPAEIARIGVELCRALDAVHQAGLVHRDVKAQNVLRDRHGRIVLGDFGTGRDLDDAGDLGGTLAGTPAYVAPEIFEGDRATPQSDVYSLGALLFRLATGTFPVAGRSLRELRDAHARGTRVSVKALRPDLPDGLATTIDTALESDLSHRFRTASEFEQALEGPAGQPRPAGRTTGRIAFAALSVLLATAVGIGALMLRTGADIAFEKGDWAMVGDVENRTGEPVFDGTLRVALERELAVSSVLNLVPLADGRLDLLQASLGRPSGQPAQPAEGIEPRILLAGDIVAGRGGYVVSVRVTEPVHNTVIAEFVEDAGRPDQVLDAVARIARRIRHGIGEASASAPTKFPATLDALHGYAEAVDLLWDPRPEDRSRAVSLLDDVLDNSPQFAPARVLRAEFARDREAALVDADLVIAAVPNPPDPEQLLVLGRAYQIKGLLSREPLQQEQANERAVAAFEALLRVQPARLLALHRLSAMYRRTGRLEAATALGLRLADHLPRLALPQVTAALELLDHGRLDEALLYVARARALDPEGKTLPAWHAAWFRLFDAQEAWLRADATAALSATDRVAAAAANLEGPHLDQAMLHISMMYLALGCFDRASDAISRMSSDGSNTWRAVVLLAKEDIPALQAFLRSNFAAITEARQVGSLLIDAGLLAEARSVVAEGPSLNYSSQLLLAEGRLDEAIRGLRLALDRHTGRANPGRPRVARKLAEALARKGDLTAAIAVLKEESARRVAATAGISSGYEWLMVSDQLIQLYRKTGHASEAAALESELSKLLVVADEDHPIKRRLQTAAHPSSGRH